MRCPSCGTDNPAGARFCSSCGTALEDAAKAPVPDESPPAVDAGPPSSTGAAGSDRAAAVRDRVRTGWPTAIRWAFLPLIAAFALGVVVSALGAGAQPFGFAPVPPELEGVDVSPLDVVTGGLIGAYGYHQASLTIELPPFEIPDAPFPGGLGFSGSASFAPMLGTALVALLLARAGLATARASTPGPWWGRLVDGTKIALPYSIIALAVSFAARQTIELPQIEGGPFAAGAGITIGVSPLSAFVWSFLLAAVFGALGGAWSGRAEALPGTWGSRARAALAGGWRMTWVALALSFVGLLVLAAVHDEGTRTYFEIVGELGGTGGVAFVLSTILALPNMATWVTAGAVGGSAMSVSFFGSSCGLVSYLSFPSGVREGDVAAGPEAFFADPCAVLPIRFETAPAGYFLFLLVPIVAVLAGGMLAARRAGVEGMGGRAAAGASAGLVFGLSFLALEILSDMKFALDFEVPFFNFGSGDFGFGPGLVSGAGLALLWGVAGGALGALLVRTPRRPEVTPP